MPNRVLIVDDEIDALAAWETALRKAGYLVRTASTASAALALCDESMFDLVILDYVMPKMKGLELLARIRGKIPMVRSILASGKLGIPEQQIKESIRGDVETDRYFHKPVTNEQLLDAVEEVLKEAQSRRPWTDVAAAHIEGGKGTLSKAKGAQAKLSSHGRKRH